jgi:hypothetical protein
MYWLVPVARLNKLDYERVGELKLKIEVLRGRKKLYEQEFDVTWPLCP